MAEAHFVQPPPAVQRPLQAAEGRPRPLLSLTDGIAIVIGIVIGSAIFETPALVAANAGSAGNVVFVWILGGVISIMGALCYAELASAYPHTGGDYHYLDRAYGKNVAFLFAWARMTVIQTGSIALIAFVFGDYASQIFRLGPYSASIYAGSAVVLLTLGHLVGVQLSVNGQRWLTAAQIGGLLLLVGAGWLFASGTPAPAEAMRPMSASSFGLAMVFVLLSYGGWNEAAYVSGELRKPKKNIVRVLILSILIIASFYVVLNLVLLQRLGIEGMAGSEAVGADLMRLVAGESGAVMVSLLVVACALASINAMIFTGARTSYAMGRDFLLFSRVGRWRRGGSVPVNALLLQASIILFLVLFGAVRRKGFETMVDYTAPVFWLFFLLTTISLIVLRRKDPTPRPFRVPFYPVTPVLFALTCAYLLYSSIMYTGVGSFIGLGMVISGIPILLICRRREARNAK
ncbi:MAG TPA: amino acid permease [Thermoanaerobaculia bacterium]